MKAELACQIWRSEKDRSQRSNPEFPYTSIKYVLLFACDTQNSVLICLSLPLLSQALILLVPNSQFCIHCNLTRYKDMHVTVPTYKQHDLKAF